MNKARHNLISELSANLVAVKNPGRISGMATGWLAFSFFVAAMLTIAVGPLRDGSIDALATHPQFLLESMVGVVAIVALGRAAFQLGLPAVSPAGKIIAPALILLVFWIGFYIYGLWYPALQPSMLGKRDFCEIETLIIGVPAMLAALYLARRLWPVHGGGAGLLAGLSAGATPALIMQFACMYEPQHILMFHLAPGLAVGGIGALLGWLVLRPNQ